jgi:hypothetical protein
MDRERAHWHINWYALQINYLDRPCTNLFRSPIWVAALQLLHLRRLLFVADFLELSPMDLW